MSMPFSRPSEASEWSKHAGQAGASDTKANRERGLA
jgi:hypothetical protein